MRSLIPRGSSLFFNRNWDNYGRVRVSYGLLMATYPVSPVKVTAKIPGTPEDVLAFVADTRNDPLWCPNVETVEQTEGHGIHEGAKFRFHQHLDRPGSGRIQFDVDTEVTTLTNNSVTWDVKDRFQERTITIRVESNGDNTIIRQETSASFLKPPGITKWLYPFMARRIFKDQFKHLAAHLAA